MTFQSFAGGRFVAENMPLRLLIQRAYDVRPFQISGAPNWIDSERYDITARADASAPEKQIMGPMLQALLESRFRLKLRRQLKQLPVLNLTAKAAGARLKKSNAADCAGGQPSSPSTGSSPLPCHEVVLSISPTGARLRGEQASTGQLVFTLANLLGRPVIDKTAFTGQFDLDLEVSLEGLEGIRSSLGIPATSPAPDSMVPSLLTALPQQLGLTLTAGKGPVEVLVIEHVERPADMDQQ
jgi:uncharacterized protein (TIGR03435 family)